MSVPSTPRHQKHLTRDQRLMVHTLSKAGFEPIRIANHLGFTTRQVRYVLKGPVTPKKRSGRPPSLSTEQVQELIAFVRSSRQTRRMSYLALAHHFEHWHVGEKAIRTALKSAGYERRVALAKPPLTPEIKARRMAFAEACKDWTLEQWSTILWSDETWVTGGRHKKILVTRMIGEELDDTCLVDKIPKRRGWMFWGSFAGRQKGPYLFWEKAWKSINTARYCERVVPLVDEWMRVHSGYIFMQDNARPHASRGTIQELLSRGVVILQWPAYSPDLNPIETVWHKMKEYIQNKYPDLKYGRQRSYPKLRKIIQEAWDLITPEDLISILDTMGDRCRAVIAAQGGHIPY